MLKPRPYTLFLCVFFQNCDAVAHSPQCFFGDYDLDEFSYKLISCRWIAKHEERVRAALSQPAQEGEEHERI
ncbi:hypothetical protein [Roseibium sp. MMSF_3412]|uniref:hypothetical protein n=1 Tax=Roseibium sp. MMSF_3412 TaxID=3046712 RepID=UPI00273E06FE|nr:hypothetical protein [Roseibium sp. MMSF_3412]